MTVAVRAGVQIAKPRRDGLRVHARVSFAGRTDEIFFSTSAGPIAAAAEAWAAVALPAAMVDGCPVRVAAPLSQAFRDGVRRVQEVFHGWEDWLEVVAVEGESARQTAVPGSRVGCFFSGGLDSFYTVLTRAEEISELIFVHGFDISLENRGLREEVVGRLGSAAEELGKPLLEVATNLREFTDRHFNWGAFHLAGQAAVAYVLAPRFRKVYVPATHPDEYYANDSVTSGSHPSLPALWSTDAVELAQHGGDSGRVAKARLIAEHDVALKTLRVCWWNPGGAYNCGCCEKCLLTMVALRAVGALEECDTFEKELSLSRVASLSLGYESSRFFMTENLRALEESGRDPELEAAVRAALERGR